MPNEQKTENPPEFIELKHHLNSIFKIIWNRLRAGELPTDIECEVFCRHAERITTYAKFDGESTSSFLNLIREFEKVFQRGDKAACNLKFSEIRTMKNRCHNTFPP